MRPADALQVSSWFGILPGDLSSLRRFFFNFVWPDVLPVHPEEIIHGLFLKPGKELSERSRIILQGI